MERISAADVVTSPTSGAGDKFDPEVFSEASSAVVGTSGADVVISSVAVAGAEDTTSLRVTTVCGAGDVSAWAGVELGAGEEPGGATVECIASFC